MIITARCPDCQTDTPENESGKIIIPVDAQVGEILECPECGAEVEILSLNPPIISLLVEEK
jgi:lysine biosynthesis protein LysW